VADVEAVLPHLTAHLAGAVRLQLVTGARPGEALAVRLADIDRAGPVWVYRPRQHKTRHRGKERLIPIGPRGQAVLRELIRIRCPLCGSEGRPPRLGSYNGVTCGPCADRMEEAGASGPWQRVEAQPADAYLFSPAEAMAERAADRRALRKSRVQPSQLCRKVPAPGRKPGEVYGVQAYGKAIARACKAAGVPHFHPHRLRHARATEIRRLFGVEAAKTVLGHSQLSVTEVYAERDLALAVRVANEIG
jgi:integrase